MVEGKDYIENQTMFDDNKLDKDIVKLNSCNHELSKIVGSKAKRMSRKEKEGGIRIIQGVKSALSVGWSLVIPLAMCLGLGMWVESKLKTETSFIVVISVMIGIALGGVNVWYNLKKEKLIDREENEKLDKESEEKVF